MKDSKISDILKRIERCMEYEDRKEAWFRVLIAVTETGDIIKYITHDKELNPSARSHGTKEDEELAYGQAIVQTLAAAQLRGVNIEKAIEVGLKNWEEADWRKRQAVEGVDRVEGRVACNGSVTGTAYVVSSKSPHRIEKMIAGQVLITEFVTPEMTLYLQTNKPIAIVTDQGGTMSHAAIIAREKLKVPCIVGTGDATKKIQHGQTVFVDAKGKMGTVKIEE